jgi:hypothetical protein
VHVAADENAVELQYYTKENITFNSIMYNMIQANCHEYNAVNSRQKDFEIAQPDERPKGKRKADMKHKNQDKYAKGKSGKKIVFDNCSDI